MSDWQQTAYNRQLIWLNTMANHPGFKDHAEHMARLMDKAPSGLFKGIEADLKRMRKSSEGPKKAGNA